MKTFWYFVFLGILYAWTWLGILRLSLRCAIFKPWALFQFWAILKSQLPGVMAQIKQDVWKIINE